MVSGSWAGPTSCSPSKQIEKSRNSGEETKEGKCTEIYEEDFLFFRKKTNQNLIFHLHNIKPHPDGATHHLLTQKPWQGSIFWEPGGAKQRSEVVLRYSAQPEAQQLNTAREHVSDITGLPDPP